MERVSARAATACAGLRWHPPCVRLPLHSSLSTHLGQRDGSASVARGKGHRSCVGHSHAVAGGDRVGGGVGERGAVASGQRLSSSVGHSHAVADGQGVGSSVGHRGAVAWEVGGKVGVRQRQQS